MSDLEIVKALECCGRNSIAGWLNDCKNCPLNDRTTCIPELIYKAKDLINRLQAENEFLKEYNKNLLTANTTLSNEILDTKTVAYKEFAERLKEKAYTYSDITGYQSTVVDVCEIDGTYKEMVGE